MITKAEILRCLWAVLRWWWVVVLAVVLSSSVAFLLTMNQPRTYMARATLMIGNTFTSQLPDQNQLSISLALSGYYGELVRREPILKPVAENLKLPFTWQFLSDRMLQINPIRGANLLDIYVTDTNPERAAWIANSIGEQLIAFSPNAPDKIEAEQAAIAQQLQMSDNKIKDLQQQINALTERQGQATSASDLAEINRRLAELNVSLSQEQNTYNSLLNYKNNSAVNSLSFFERATPPTTPLPTKRKILIGSAALAGALLAMLAIYVLEWLDNRVHGSRDVELHLNVPILGSVPHGPPLHATSQALLGPRLEATREAQTNLMLQAAESNMQFLMVTSAQPNEARSAFSLDLADLFARAGHKVLLVDADTTHSYLTRMLLPNGLPNQQQVLTNKDRANVWSYLQSTPLQNVALLPGPSNPNGMPAMLPSLRWRELVDQLRNTADIIIFDGPATLLGPDAALLAPHLDGVVLTIDPNTDSREQILKSKERLLHQPGTRLLGAVNFVPPSEPGEKGPIWKQLRRPTPPLLTVSETLNTIAAPPADKPTTSVIITPAPQPQAEEAEAEQAKAPLITPAPSDEGDVQVMKQAKAPLITPAPSDVDDALVLDAEPEQKQANTKAPPPVVARRPSRRNTRSRSRAKRSHAED
jgi:succinoglycan biosynthesis transport protein ExoP